MQEVAELDPDVVIKAAAIVVRGMCTIVSLLLSSLIILYTEEPVSNFNLSKVPDGGALGE